MALGLFVVSARLTACLSRLATRGRAARRYAAARKKPWEAVGSRCAVPRKVDLGFSNDVVIICSCPSTQRNLLALACALCAFVSVTRPCIVPRWAGVSSTPIVADFVIRSAWTLHSPHLCLHDRRG